MKESGAAQDGRVAVMVDCDNTSPEVLAHGLRVVAQFGCVVLRRGYKLRERGATVYFIGEAKTLDALRNTSDQFFEHAPPDTALSTEESKPAPAKTVKRRPKSLISAVVLLARRCVGRPSRRCRPGVHHKKRKSRGAVDSPRSPQHS